MNGSFVGGMGVGGYTYNSEGFWDARLASVENELKHTVWDESADTMPDPDLSEALHCIDRARYHLARRRNPGWFWAFCSEQCEEAELATAPDVDEDDEGDSTGDEPCCGGFSLPPVYFVFEVLEDAS